jgi:photosystem II stability/assembly factor-like uncharacterized protein
MLPTEMIRKLFRTRGRIGVPRRRRSVALDLSQATDCRLEDRTLLSTNFPLSVGTWTAIGPAPINTGSPTYNPYAGRITGVAVSPSDANTIYIAAAGGGVWKTTNGGTNWTPLTDNLSDGSGNPIPLFMGSIAIDPLNPNIIYAGTGEANNSLDSFAGRGILKSTNAGATWTLLNDRGAFEGSTVAKIVPISDNLVYAVVDGYGSSHDHGTPNLGVYRSTDGGATWTDTTFGFPYWGLNEYSDLVASSNDSMLYMAVGNYFGNYLATNGVYKSINEGRSWSLVPSVPYGGQDGRIALALSGDNTTLYVSIANASFSNVSNATLYKMLKVTTATDTAVDLTATTPNYMGVPPNAQGYYDTTLAVSPTDPTNNTVYAGGSTNGGSPGNIYTTDGGVNWPNISFVSAQPPHSDDHAAVFDRNGDLVSGNDGGIWRYHYDAVTPTWTNLNGNLNITQFTGIALDPSNANVAYGGSQDNGTEKFTDASTWTRLVGGDGGFTRVDPNNPSTVYRTHFYSSLERSDNGGSTWLNPIGALPNPNSGNFYSPYVIDPNNSHVLFGTAELWLSTDKGFSWTNITTGQTGSSPISAVAVAKGTGGQTIYLATNAGNVYVTINGAAASPTWTQINVPSVAGPWNDIQVDPTNSQIVYLARSAYNMPTIQGHVFRSTNGGTKWSDISTSLPDIPTDSLALNVQGGNTTIYAGTDMGVYSSSNLGVTWARFDSGMPNVQVVNLDYNAAMNILAAGTHGRGMWETLTQALMTVTNVSSTTANGTYGTGATIAITVTYSGPPTVTGTPQLALSDGGVASYVSTSGNTLTFSYVVSAGETTNGNPLDEASSSALTLNGGTIKDANGNIASLAVPAPGSAGSLGVNKNIIIDAIAPTVVSYNVIYGTNNLVYNLLTSSRNDLPWQITAIQVVFSKAIGTGDINSLTGLTNSGFSGLGTTTLTWTISTLSVGSVSTSLMGTGADAIKDNLGNSLTAGSGFARNFKVLFGDVNDDGVVNSADLLAVQIAIGTGSIYADVNGDGVVNFTDYQAVRKRLFTHL